MSIGIPGIDWAAGKKPRSLSRHPGWLAARRCTETQPRATPCSMATGWSRKWSAIQW